MEKKVTIQDIADALGLSRNTVSKALNNTGVLAAETRQRVLEKAAEMGYRRFIYLSHPSSSSEENVEIKELALITQNMPYGSHFGTYALNTFQEKISRNNYRLSMFPVRDTEISSLQLPKGFNKEKTAGILCLEMFDPEYIEMLDTLGIPLLFIDTAADTDMTQIRADFLLMENHLSVYNLTDTLIQNGYRNLAFAGEPGHCRSFNERYQGFMHALNDNMLTPAASQFTGRTVFDSPQDLEEANSRTMQLPDVFVCPNDFVAIDQIHALKKRGIRIPEDVLVTGFDNSTESRIIDPHLTTVDIPSSKMGYIAADMLLSRIKEPDTPYRIMHVRTTLKFRESTGELKL